MFCLSFLAASEEKNCALFIGRCHYSCQVAGEALLSLCVCNKQESIQVSRSDLGSD